MPKLKHTLKGLSKITSQGYIVSSVILEIYMVTLWKVQSECFLYTSPTEQEILLKISCPLLWKSSIRIFAQFIAEESYIYYKRNAKLCSVLLV